MRLFNSDKQKGISEDFPHHKKWAWGGAVDGACIPIAIRTRLQTPMSIIFLFWFFFLL